MVALVAITVGTWSRQTPSSATESSDLLVAASTLDLEALIGMRSAGEAEATPLTVSSSSQPVDDACRDPVGQFEKLVVDMRELHDAGQVEALRDRIDQPVLLGTDETGTRPGRFAFQGRQLTVDFRSWRACALELGQDERLFTAVFSAFASESRRLLEPVWSGLLSEFGGCRKETLWVRLEKLEALRTEITWAGASSIDPLTGTSLIDILSDSCMGVLLSARCDDGELSSKSLAALATLGQLFEGVDQVSFYTVLAMAYPWSPQMAQMTLELLSEADTAWAGIEVLWVSQLDGDINVDVIQSLFASLPGLSERLLSGAAGSETVGPAAVLLTVCGDWGEQQFREYMDTTPENLATMVGYLGLCDAPGSSLASITEFTRHADAEVRAESWRAVGLRARSDPEALGWLQRQLDASTTTDETFAGAVEGLSASALPEAAQILGASLVNTGLPATMRAQAVSGYATMPDADLQLLESLALAGNSEAEEVRVQAVMGRFSRSQNLHEGVQFLAGLVDDPSMQLSGLAAAAVDTYFSKIQLDGDDHDAWMARPKPAGFVVYSAMRPRELAAFLEPYSNSEHRREADRLNDLSHLLGSEKAASRVHAAAFMADALAQLAAAAAEDD
jgi:hypothetical protein